MVRAAGNIFARLGINLNVGREAVLASLRVEPGDVNLLRRSRNMLDTLKGNFRFFSHALAPSLASTPTMVAGRSGAATSIVAPSAPNPPRRPLRLSAGSRRARVIRLLRSLSSALFWTLALLIGAAVTAVLFGMAAFLATVVAP